MWRFWEGPEDAKWEDWESTSEYDTDIDDAVERLTNDLKARVDDLHALQEQQPPQEETAMLVQQVVLPVASGTPEITQLSGRRSVLPFGNNWWRLRLKPTVSTPLAKGR